MKVCAIGGGSGGHILPIVILASALKHTGDSLFWIGESNSMDSRKASDHEIVFFGIPAVKIQRFLSLSLILQPYYFVAGYIRSLLILRRERPEVVFCKGGGVALASGLAARTLGIPLVLHESDTRAGLTNRVLGGGAHMVLLGFAEAAPEF